MKLRNAATSAMKEWGYGDGYRYPHAEGGHAGGETYLPDALEGRRYYEPKRAGFEARIAQRLARLRGDQPSDQVASSESDPSSGSTENEP
jgi:putative ATPase